MMQRLLGALEAPRISPPTRQSLLRGILAYRAVVGIWIEKGMGLIVPGFVPTPLGQVVEYVPSLIEIGVSAGIWGFGALLFLVLAKVSIAIDSGRLHAPVRGLVTPGGS